MKNDKDMIINEITSILKTKDISFLVYVMGLIKGLSKEKDV